LNEQQGSDILAINNHLFIEKIIQPPRHHSLFD